MTASATRTSTPPAMTGAPGRSPRPSPNATSSTAEPAARPASVGPRRRRGSPRNRTHTPPRVRGARPLPRPTGVRRESTRVPHPHARVGAPARAPAVDHLPPQPGREVDTRGQPLDRRRHEQPALRAGSDPHTLTVDVGDGELGELEAADRA